MENFEILEKLGEGSFSTVYKVRRKIDNQLYALKKVSLQNLKEKNILNSLNEIRLLASIKSNYIISYKEAFYEEKENSLIIIMEYADNGDLSNKIKNIKKFRQHFEEKEIWIIFIQLIKGLKSLHDLNILHRDIKSANVFLFQNGMVKLGDLNVSKIVKKGLSYTQTGTPYYAAPEVWKDLPYSYKSDMWSLGCVLYEMITLNLPFSNSGNLFNNILKGEFKKIPEIYSDDLNYIVHLLIQINQDKRPSCKELLNNNIIKNRIEYYKNEIMDNYYSDNSMENSLLLKTIEFPKNLSKTPFKLPKANYSKNENEKSFEKLKNNINNVSYLNNHNFSNDNNNNNSNLPVINNTRKIFYNKCRINYGNNGKFGIHRVLNSIKNNNNKNEENNKDNNPPNKNYLLKNYNMQWIKMRNNGDLNNINKNFLINKSNDTIKIMKLYKPFKISNNFSNNKIKIKIKEKNNLINKSEEKVLPVIKRNYNNNIYSQIQINKTLNLK